MYRAVVTSVRTLLPCVLLAASPGLATAACTPAPHTHLGCDFYAVTLPNPLLDQATFAFGVDIVNPGSAAVDVGIDGGALAVPTAFSVGAGASVITTLPWVSSLSSGTATTKVPHGAYHVTTSAAVSALQLNPTQAQQAAAYSYTNDGSLLLPVESGGTAFRVVAWPTQDLGGQYPGFAAVVATVDATTVQVAANGVIQPGAGLTADGGGVALDRGDVLLVTSKLDASGAFAGSSLDGASITSDQPVLVFVGHALAQVPVGTSYGDHLEESLPPLAAAGGDYLIVRPGAPPGSASPAEHYVTLIGTVDGTTLAYDPPVTGAPTGIGAGGSFHFSATLDFHLHADHPVVVATYIEGAGKFGGTASAGDPSMTIAVPIDQARRSIDFLAPLALAPAFAQVVAPTGAVVAIDGTPVGGWTAIGGSGWSSTNVALCCTERHHASGNRAFTLSVYAYPSYTSYWYPAAVGFEDIFADGFD